MSGGDSTKKGSILLKRKPSSSWEYKISTSEFVSSTTAEERHFLREYLCYALINSLEEFHPIYLEKFGLLFPVTSKNIKPSLVGNDCFLTKNEELSISFEKCSELLPIHKENYPTIIETAHLCKYIYDELLPKSLKDRWTLKALRRNLRGLISTIRDEVVVEGYSPQLSSLGELFALHNRQGKTLLDWYAGANIALVPKYKKPLESKVISKFEQPTLDSSYEIFHAAFGRSIGKYNFQVKDELRALGYDTERFEEQVPKNEQSISFSVFLDESSSKKHSRYLFVTDGVRSYSSDPKGVELTVQLPVDNTDIDKKLVLARSLLALGWILIQSNEKKSLTSNCLLCAECGFIPNTTQSAIYTAPFTQAKLPQKANDKFFSYINITAITEDEFRFGNLRSPEHLRTLLSFKSYDQVTYPARRSILGKHSTLGVSSTKIAA